MAARSDLYQPLSSSQLAAITVAVAEAVSNTIQANNSPQPSVTQPADRSER